jgi:hypothetical protein
MSARPLLGALAALLAGCAAESSLCGPRVSPGACPLALVTRPFSEKLFCPPGRITARPRPDLAVHRFACAGFDAGAVWRSTGDMHEKCDELPPAEVAADAERLALWRRLRAAEWEAYDRSFTDTFEISGCGERRFYACRRAYIRSVATVRCEGPGLLDLGAQEP